MKNRCLATSAFPHNFDPHSRLAIRQGLLAPDQNSEEPSCQNSDSSSYFGISQCDFICLAGDPEVDLKEIRFWLDASLQRRVVCIDEDPAVLQRAQEMLFESLQLKCYLLETPLQVEALAKEIGQRGSLMQARCIRSMKPWALQFQRYFEQMHRTASLLLSDAADFGKQALAHSLTLLPSSWHKGTDLANAFANIPAVIVGAGPSLEKNGHLLPGLSERALIFAGGSALINCPVQPHFAALIDPHQACQGASNFNLTPFCFQHRMHRDNFTHLGKCALLFPDSHHAFLNWIHQDALLWDGGWNVGNFLTSIALWMGCNPIVFIGTDLCYAEDRKYARNIPSPTSREPLVKVHLGQGKSVWTQPDWLMAWDWTLALAKKHPDRTFIDAREGGLTWEPPIQASRLSELVFEKQKSLPKKIEQILHSLPRYSQSSCRWEAWGCNVAAMQKKIGHALDLLAQKAIDLPELEWPEEIVYQMLLLPLWQAWRPIWERALDLEPSREQVSFKLQLHRLLFFQKILEEHQHVLA